MFIDRNSRVIVQGFTAQIGTLHAQAMIRYGTCVGGGVTPGKGDTKHLDRPEFGATVAAVLARRAESHHRSAA